MIAIFFSLSFRLFHIQPVREEWSRILSPYSTDIPDGFCALHALWIAYITCKGLIVEEDISFIET